MTRKSKKQFQNQAQAGYMQSNELQIAGGEAGKKNRIKTHSQDGRSMIEMLGVLAIIGVLSIGGIVGYKLAMNYYQASQIAHEMNMMRTDAQIKIAQGTENLTLGSPYDEHKINFNGYETAFGCKYVNEDDIISEETVSCQIANAYFIELPKIPDGVCQPLIRLINGMDNLIAFSVNGPEYEEGGTCQEGENDLYAVFSGETVSDLTHCEGDDDCKELESTSVCDLSRHVCVECTQEKGCEGESEYCENNVCKTCENGVWNGENCVECTADDDCTDTPDTPVCNTEEYRCVECLTYEHCTGKDETPQCDEISHTCKSCADIDSSKPLWYNNKCVECVNSTDCAETLVCKENTCSPCEKEDECQAKGENYHCSNASICIQCDTNEVWDDESKACVECMADSDCTDTPDTPKCNTGTNTCMECLNNQNCIEKDTNNPVCNSDTNTCEPCPPKSIFYEGECHEYECRTNEDCADKGSDYYCYLKEGYLWNSEWENKPGTYFGGHCHKAEEDKILGGITHYVKSKDIMTWWSAQRFCKALNMTPVSSSDISCGDVNELASCTSSMVANLRNDFPIVGTYGLWLEPIDDPMNEFYRAVRSIFLDNGAIDPDNRANGDGTPNYGFCRH